jgi:hypothetical protein
VSKGREGGWEGGREGGGGRKRERERLSTRAGDSLMSPPPQHPQALAVQLKMESDMSMDRPYLTVQCALLYTALDGTRRIRSASVLVCWCAGVLVCWCTSVLALSLSLCW